MHSTLTALFGLAQAATLGLIIVIAALLLLWSLTSSASLRLQARPLNPFNPFPGTGNETGAFASSQPTREELPAPSATVGMILPPLLTVPQKAALAVSLATFGGHGLFYLADWIGLA